MKEGGNVAYTRMQTRAHVCACVRVRVRVSVCVKVRKSEREREREREREVWIRSICRLQALTYAWILSL